MSWDSSWVRTSLPWPLVRLKDHVDLTNGFPFDSARFNPSVGTPVIRIRDLLTGTTQTYFEGHVPPEVMVGHGDLLIGMDGDFNAATWTGEPAALNQRLCLIRAGPSIEQRYLGYVIPFPLKAINDVTFWTTVKHLSSLDLLAERIPLPPLAVQRAIADYLDRETARIDALIEKKRQMIELVEMRFWTALVDAILQLDAPLTPIRRVLTFLTDGPFGSAFTSQDYSEGGAAVVRLGNLGFAEYKPFEQAFIPQSLYWSFQRHRVLPGDLLIAGLGDPSNHPGRACVAPDLGPAIVKGKCFCARVDVRRASTDYLALLLSSPYGAQAVGASGRGSTRTMINLEIIKETPLPLPAVSDQERIVQAANRHRRRTRSLVVVLTDQISRLGEHRQALITAAVTGELEVPEVPGVPA